MHDLLNMFASLSLVLLPLFQIYLIAFNALKNFALLLKPLANSVTTEVSEGYAFSRGTQRLWRVQMIHYRFGGVTGLHFLPCS
jgi:hypothetical protein